MTSQRVILSYFVIAGLHTLAAALIWGVNTLFLLAAGLDIFGVFVANAAFRAGMVVFEIPTGVFADTRGRRASFLMSIAILCATTLAYVGVAKTHGGPGRRGPRAAQGLPQVAQVDTIAREPVV